MENHRRELYQRIIAAGGKDHCAAGLDSVVEVQTNDISSRVVKSNPFKLKTCGQSYKQFTLVIYESGVVIWGIFKSGTTLES